MPSLPIERGMPTANLLAHVLVSKYADHLPLYWQSGIYACGGMELSRSLLANWVGKCSSLMEPLIDAIERHVLAGSHIHATIHRCLSLSLAGGKQGRAGYGFIFTKNGRMAVIRHQPPFIAIHLIARAFIRRRFCKTLPVISISKPTKEALDHIGHLFDIERQIINKPPDDRLAVRQSHSLRQLGETKNCFAHSLRKIPDKSDLAGALRYALTRWDVCL